MTVDNLLGKAKSNAIPRFSPDDYHDFLYSKIASVRSATAATSSPMSTPCTIPDLATFTTVSVDDVVRVIRMSVTFKAVSLWPPSNVAHQGMCVHRCSVHHALNLSLTGGDFQSPRKHAIMTTLLKKAGLDDSSSPAVGQFPIFHTYQRLLRRLSIARCSAA